MQAEPLFVAVARIRRPHGLKGEILATPLTDFPERIKPEATFYLGEDHSPVTVHSRRTHNQGLLLSFKEFQTRDAIDPLRNIFLYAKTKDLPDLEEGEYYQHQLLGFEVIDEGDSNLGTLAEILQTGANDVYIVKSQSGKEHLLPATTEVILDISLEKKQIKVRLIPGLET